MARSSLFLGGTVAIAMDWSSSGGVAVLHPMLNVVALLDSDAVMPLNCLQRGTYSTIRIVREDSDG